jgi:hypothetical protein
MTFFQKNKMPKYLLLMPQGGLNDCFVQIKRAINYCQEHKRTLLIDTRNSTYRINFSDYFSIKCDGIDIIYDSDAIKDIILNKELSILPETLSRAGLLDILSGNEILKYTNARYWRSTQGKLKFPKTSYEEDVIVSASYGGGNGFSILKLISLKQKFKNLCKKRVEKLKGEYLCIHVRNTDLKCDFKSLYINNKEEMHSYDYIYVCTDDKSVLDYFRSKDLNVFNFCSFPEFPSNLHSRMNGLKPEEIIRDIFVDIFIAANSKEFLSNSKGGFVDLIFNSRKLKNKYTILSKLK